MNITSLILQMRIGMSSRQFLQPTIIELFSIANDSISFNQLKYTIIYKSLNYLLVMCLDMDHLKSGKHHIIVHLHLSNLIHISNCKLVLTSQPIILDHIIL
jgi:hypothetical protein